MEDNKLTLEELGKTIEIMKALREDVAKVKANMMSQEEFEAKAAPLIEKALAEQAKAAEAKASATALWPSGSYSGDPRGVAVKAAFAEKDPENRGTLLAEAFRLPTENKALEQLRTVNDELAIVDAYMAAKMGRNYRGVQSLDTYKRFCDVRDRALKYMDTADTSSWVPTGSAAVLLETPFVAGGVEPLFEHVTCPTKTYTYPILIDSPTDLPTLVSETTSHTNPYDDSTTQSLTDGSFSWTAVKGRVRVITSGELTEDSIIALVPAIKGQIARKHVHGAESAILNGDTTSTHQDSDVTVSTDFRKAWKGLRKLAIAGSLTEDLGTWSMDTLTGTLRSNLDIYGVAPKELAWIVGPKVYARYLLVADDYKTLNYYGPNAVVFTGELGQIDGIPVVVSQHMRENLNASGVYDGVTTNNGCIILVNRNYFKVGDRRLTTVEAERWLNTDQYNFVSFRRVDFQPHQAPSTTYSSVALAYNIDLA